MSLIEYARKVQEMRAAQKRFFAGDRSLPTLSRAKELEAEIDRLTREVLGGQRSFFDVKEAPAP